MAITMTSFDQVSALIGHMAQAERAPRKQGREL
jgi:hypothetical protein